MLLNLATFFLTNQLINCMLIVVTLSRTILLSMLCFKLWSWYSEFAVLFFSVFCFMCNKWAIYSSLILASKYSSLDDYYIHSLNISNWVIAIDSIMHRYFILLISAVMLNDNYLACSSILVFSSHLILHYCHFIN